MSKIVRLSHSKIEYILNPDGSQGYMWGIWSGCHNWANGICGDGRDFNCWARSLATRFHNIYPNGFEPTYYPEALNSPKSLKKPSMIAVGWVGDVIGYGLEYKEQIYSTIRDCPQHRFLFLTKNPEELMRWSPFPLNTNIGVSVTNQEQYDNALKYLILIEAPVKFLSFEPLLGRIDLTL